MLAHCVKLAGVLTGAACLVFSGSIACSGHSACAPDCAKSPVIRAHTPPEDPKAFEALYGEEVAPPDLIEPPPDAQRTESGLASQIVDPGQGEVKPSERDEVTFHFTGWGPDGQRFASTFGAKPRTAVVAELAPGWAEAIQLMTKGERRRFWIPELLARSPAYQRIFARYD